MLRRWLIRSLALMLLTLCVVAWVGSRFFYFQVDRRSPLLILTFWIGGGMVGYQHTHVPGASTGAHWSWGCGRYSYPFEWINHDPEAHHFIVLSYKVATPSAIESNVWIPLWFPVLVSGVLLWFFWQNTKPNPQGFPIAPAAPTTEVKSQ